MKQKQKVGEAQQKLLTVQWNQNEKNRNHRFSARWSLRLTQGHPLYLPEQWEGTQIYNQQNSYSLLLFNR